MRILHLIYDDPANKWCGGGGSIRAFEINKRIAKKYEVFVLTGRFPGSKNEKIDNINFIRVGSSKSYLLSRISFTLLIPFLLKKYKPDIIINDFSVFSPVFCEFFTSIPVINSFYHFIGKHAVKKYSVFGLIPFFAEILLLKISKNYITISPSVTKILEEKIGKEKQIRCIYTGIPDEMFNSRNVIGEYIAYMGRIDIYMKGIDILLKAFSEIKSNIKLKIAGIGKQKDIDKLHSMIKELNLCEKVEFLGSLSEKDKIDYLSHSIFVVMPSRFEGWGIVAIEAQACGKPVIGTDIPGLKDAVRHGITGLLVKPEDPVSLRNAINELISDEGKREKLSLEGRKWAKNFKWDKIAEDQLSYYSDIINLIN